MLLCFLLVVASTLAILKLRMPPAASAKFCTADGLIGPAGNVYGRDIHQGCKFVDENGDVLPGQP
jgi:hypothetical protein